jgi:hypothetical protein
MAKRKTARTLESKEAASKATNADRVVPTRAIHADRPAGETGTTAKKGKVDLAQEYPRAFDAGRRAKRSNIPENQAPVMNDKEREAYLEGYKAG